MVGIVPVVAVVGYLKWNRMPDVVRQLSKITTIVKHHNCQTSQVSKHHKDNKFTYRM